MERMKVFFKYIIIIALFWVFSNLIIYVSINVTYKHIDVQIPNNIPNLTINDCKATKINGYVKGSIKNNTNQIINKKYVKIDCFSESNIKLGTKYITIENLEPNKEKEFEMYFKFSNVNYVIVSTTDNITDATEEEFLSEKVSSYVLLGTLVCLFLI